MPRRTAPEEVLRENKDRGAVGDNHNVASPESQKQLRALSERIMNLLDQRDAVNGDLREVFNEAKDSGFETKILRKAIAKKRKIDKDKAAYESEEEQIAAYFAALYQPELPFEPESPVVRLAAAGLND